MKSRFFALAMVVCCALGWTGCAGVQPGTVGSVLKIATEIGGVVVGKEIHKELKKFGVAEKDCQDLSTQTLSLLTSDVRHGIVRYVATQNQPERVNLDRGRVLEAEPGEYVYNHETPSGEKVSGRKVKYRITERGEVVHESEEVYVAETDSRVPLG